MGRKLIYSKGQIIGDSTVLEVSRENNITILLCKCNLCGDKFRINAEKLKYKKYKCCKSCGLKKRYDISGEKFGHLTAVEPVGKRKSHILWKCICDCGNETVVSVNDLHTGNTVSCGCEYKRSVEESFKDGTAPWSLTNSLRSDNKSGYPGVCWVTSKRKYKAAITFKQTTYHLGYYDDIDGAIEAKKEAENNLFGNFIKWYAEKYPEKWKKMGKNQKYKRYLSNEED
jgi:hypothetical protein